MATTRASPSNPARSSPAATVMLLSPDSIAASCGLSARELALLAGLPPTCADEDPWHPQLQSLLRDLVELFAMARARCPSETGSAFWAAHRAVRPLGGRTLVEAVADGDWAQVNAHLSIAPGRR